MCKDNLTSRGDRVDANAKLHTFTCDKCGSHELAYEKMVYCREDVFIGEDGNIRYGPPQVNCDDGLGTTDSYICRRCGQSLFGVVSEMRTENDLRYYLSMTAEEIKAEEERWLNAEESSDEEYEEACKKGLVY